MTDDLRIGAEVSWSNVEFYLDHALAAQIRLNGMANPRVDYVVAGGSVELHVELAPHERPPHSPLPLVTVDQVSEEGRRMARIRTTDPSLQRDFHDLLCAVADRIVKGRQTLGEALAETVRAWTALVRRLHATSEQQRIGLFGELVVLHTLGSGPEIGWAAAVDAWVGGSCEEHDFAMPAYDIEVKTTTSEKRSHVVHGIGQLTPKPGRPLWLISLQVTRGGAVGRTLGGLADTIREQLRGHASERLQSFDRTVEERGMMPGDSAADSASERWTLRSDAVVLAADERLPRIDDALLSALTAEQRARLSDVNYRLDLTGLASDPNAPLVLKASALP